MQFAWSRESLLPLARWRPPSGSLIAGGLALRLIVCTATSTVLANWVPGSAPVTNLALVGGIVMGGLAVSRVPWPIALAVGAVLAPLAAYVAAHQALVHAHPDDPGDPLSLLGRWLGRIAG